MNSNPQSNTNATEESFWSMLCKGFDIYIPRIQRDYAQGRLNGAALLIRERFVDDIFNCLKNNPIDGGILDVNFIYGNIEPNGDSKRFIPIDGQQRLTTLFLLHWYFALYSGKIETAEIKNRLLQFKYETRNVTGKFCKNITEYVRVNLKELPDDNEALSKVIKNYYWFFSDFENDSSVRGMLVMLDAIHNKTMEYYKSGVDLDNIFNLLTSDNAPIRFLYLNIDDVGLTDSIYIKMNARGKALTHFENFKAQLRNYLSKDENFANEFIDNINGQWSDFFWNKEYRRTIKDPETGNEIRETVFDSQMMKFFRFVMMMNYFTGVDDSVTVNNTKNIRDSLKRLLQESDYLFTSRLFKDGFQNVYSLKSSKPVLNIDSFRKINKLLNILSKRQRDTGGISFINKGEYEKEFIKEKEAFQKLIGASNDRSLNNEELVILYAECAFLMKYAASDNSFNKEVELNRWVRLVSNLVKPTLNLQLDVLFGMIRAVDQIVNSGNALDCDRYMAKLLRRNYRKSYLSTFTESQVVEESIKSILMGIDPVWKKAVIESENTFLDGQTGALFKFAGIVDEYERQIRKYEDSNINDEFLADKTQILSGVNEDSNFYLDFMNYLKKFEMLFDNNGVKMELEENSLFRRALLCYGDNDSYMLPVGKPVQCFLDNTDRDYSFKRLLRDDNGGKRDLLKQLMDDIDLNRPISEQLQEIISQKTFNEEDRWKRYFVSMPEILDCISGNTENKKDPQGDWLFCTPRRFIRKNSSDDILLLTKTQTSSINRELYSYVLFLKARKMGLKLNYAATSSDNADKYAWYTNNEGEVIHVLYKNKANKGYCYIARKEDGTERYINKDLDLMLDYISQNINMEE